MYAQTGAQISVKVKEYVNENIYLENKLAIFLGSEFIYFDLEK